MKSTKTLFRLLVSGALTASMLLPSSLAVYQAKVKADSLYLRSAPGGSGIATLSQGTTVAVTNNSSEWYKVIVDGKEGYVSGSYLTGTTATDFSVGSGKITCSSTVNLRSEANTSSSILTSLSNGTAVTITGVSGGWYKVSVNGKSGYIKADYITTSVSSSANMASYSGLSAKRTAVLDYAAKFLGVPYVYGGSTPSGFDCSGFTSYVYKNTVCSIERVAQAQFDTTTRVSRQV